jgi:hypothetical protein
LNRSGIWKFGWVAARAFLGIMFFTGGMSKLIPFPGIMGPVWLEEVLQPHGLGPYARFIAWSELFIAVLLFSRRFATVGAVMMVPLLVNIFAVVTSMEWRGTPYVVAGFIVMNVYLLWYERDRLLTLVSDGFGGPAFGPWGRDMPAVVGILACLAGPPLHALHPVLGYVTIGLGLLALAVTPRLHGRAVE